MIKNLKDFTSKSSIKPIFQGIYITPDTLVATDTYKLIEVTVKNEVKSPIVIELPKKIKSIHSVKENTVYLDVKGSTIPVKEIHDGEYPNYKAIIPT